MYRYLNWIIKWKKMQYFNVVNSVLKQLSIYLKKLLHETLPPKLYYKLKYMEARS